MRKSKLRVELEASMKAAADGLCRTFNALHRLPKEWQIVYRPGRAVRDYDGGGWRYEYDSVAVWTPGDGNTGTYLRKDIAFPAILDTCSGYQKSEFAAASAPTWTDVMMAACWELREWILEIGIPGCRESEVDAKRCYD